MIQITPTIRLLTYLESLETGLQIKTLILNHQGNNYHLHGGTRDTIHVFTEGLGIYVLTVNKSIGYMGLNAFLVPEPDPINSMFLHNYNEVRECLGSKWEQMKPITIVLKLIEYLY